MVSLTPESVSIEHAIDRQMSRCLLGIDLSEFGRTYRGKVRDTCFADEGRYVIVASDRISAFDCVLGEAIPFKGQVLNQLAAYFFEATVDLVPNHLLAVPDPNVTIADACEVVPLEFVVRGYVVGHAWREYSSGKRTLCGNTLADGYIQNSRLPSPILTPTTKAQSGHDLDTSRDEAIASGVVDAATFDKLKEYSLQLFQRGTEMAAEQGLILVDTKYEFGKRQDGELVLVDEVHTPDSSRYFYADTYDELLAADQPQRQLSKEFVREWLMDNGFRGREGEVMPVLPDDFRKSVSLRYIELFEAVTGREFIPDVHTDPAARVRAAIRTAV